MPDSNVDKEEQPLWQTQMHNHQPEVGGEIVGQKVPRQRLVEEPDLWIRACIKRIASIYTKFDISSKL